VDRHRPVEIAPLRALTFFSSIDPQPDPNTHLEAWSRYVTTNHYVLGHLLYSILGLIFAIFALGAYLARSSAGAMGLVAMVITVVGNAMFLSLHRGCDDPRLADFREHLFGTLG
jgi:hypothetical protein